MGKKKAKKKRVVKKIVKKKKKSKAQVISKTKIKNGFRIDFKKPVQIAFRFPRIKK